MKHPQENAMHGNYPQQQHQQHPSILGKLGRTFAQTCLSSWKRIGITLVCVVLVITTGILAHLLDVLVFGLEQILGALVGVALVVLVLMWAIRGIKH
jgi:hypothetical protein